MWTCLKDIPAVQFEKKLLCDSTSCVEGGVVPYRADSKQSLQRRQSHNTF